MNKKTDKVIYDRQKATLAFDSPVTTVAGISAKRAQALKKLNISTVRGLLSNYPRRYIDMSDVCTIQSARVGSSCTIKATVYEAKAKTVKRNLRLTEATFVDDTGTLIVTFFNQPWLAERLKKGIVVAISGTVEFNYGFKKMVNPFFEILENDGREFSGMIVPIQPLTGDIKAGMMRRFISNALEEVEGIIDPLPLSLRAKYRLMSRESALSCVQFPKTMEEQREARRRLAYEEVLLLELKLMGENAQQRESGAYVSHIVTGPSQQALEEVLPFQLTDEQNKARQDILEHMAECRVASHMLLGDVGTGKTIVAAFALAAVHDTGTQALLMAPTEILALQHSQSLGPLLDKIGISWDVLTGSTETEKRKEILEKAASGELTVLIGTHALLEPDVKLKNCSLVIIDEQQRFGVDQRHGLVAKGDNPDSLYLTATPIPRTLALALFGNLTLSYLTRRPRALSPRITTVHRPSEKGKAYDEALAAIKRGEQVYVVCPLVGVNRPKLPKDEESFVNEDSSVVSYGAIEIETEEDMTLAPAKAAISEAEFLQAKVFPEAKVGLVHGKMSAKEKNEVMEGFRLGQIDVLVATTVIEVGVDVPNATVMIVEDADRFGLSQLHQLRGRVGRGEKASQVHLISGTKNADSLERLKVMERTDDGFELASFDLSLRQEGDILGNRQHGASLLKLVNIVRDSALIEAAWKDARDILEEDPLLTSDAYRPLAREVALVYRQEELVSQNNGLAKDRK